MSKCFAPLHAFRFIILKSFTTSIVIPEEMPRYTFSIELILPDNDQEIQGFEFFVKKYTKGEEVRVRIDSKRRLVCSFFKWNEAKHFVFQPMELQKRQESAKGKALVNFNLQFIDFGDFLTIYNVVARRSYKIELESINKNKYILPVLHYVPELKGIFEFLDPSKIRNSSLRRFLFNVKKLDEQINNLGNKYSVENNLIDASASLRSLLLDDGGTAPQIVKKFGEKLEFSILSVYRKQDADNFETTFRLDPSSAPKSFYEVVSLPEFLNTNVVAVNGDHITVREVVKAVANGKGGVHAKLKANETKQKQLLVLDTVLNLAGQDVSLNIIREIGRVVLMALKPTVEKAIAQ